MRTLEAESGWDRQAFLEEVPALLVRQERRCPIVQDEQVGFCQVGKDGSNVTLFHKASRMALIEIPEGTVIDVSSTFYSEEGLETGYSVWEEVPPSELEERSDEGRIGSYSTMIMGSVVDLAGSYDFRDVTLQLDLDTLKVHHVQAAKYATTSYPVGQYRSERPTSPY